MRWLAALTLVAVLVAPGAARAAEPGPGAVAAPSGCPGQQVPPPPAADEEAGGPAALPWPAEPVGGLGACGEVGTAGAPVVGAAAWVLADLDSGTVLAARAPHARHRPASALKVLTALLAVRRLDPDAVVPVTVADQQVEGSKTGIGPGGRYTVRQLLAGLLLDSGNDTAGALARAMGGEAATVAAMTELAHGLGALDTRAATPSGLDGPGMSSSAYDLAVLFRAAMREPLFAVTTAARSVPFPGDGARPPFELVNGNRLLLRYPGAVGGKTGFTRAARHTLVGAAGRDGRRLVVALVRGEQTPVSMSAQAAALLDWGFARPASAAPVGRLVVEAPGALPGPAARMPAPPDRAAQDPQRAAPAPATRAAAPAGTPAGTPDPADPALPAGAVGGSLAVGALLAAGLLARRRLRG